MAGSSQDPFAHSMTDLMAGVAVTFLLIAAIFIVKSATQAKEAVDKSREASEKLEEIRSTDERAIGEIKHLLNLLSSDQTLRGLVDLTYDEERDPFLLTIVFDRGQLRFAPGDCEITEQSKLVMRSSFGSIFEQVCRSAASGLIEAIALEGHTDNHPFFPGDRICGVDRARRACGRERDRELSSECEAIGFANNVRLSAARAQNVFFEMREILTERPEIIQCLDAKFVVSGRGPVEASDGGSWRDTRSEEQNERNRRVVIKVRATSRTREQRVAP